MSSPSQTCSPLRLSSLPTAIGVRGIQRTILSCPGLRMSSPSQTCSPLRLSSLPTAIGVRGIQRTIPSYPGRLIFVGQRSQRRSCYGLLMGKPPLRPCAKCLTGGQRGRCGASSIQDNASCGFDQVKRQEGRKLCLPQAAPLGHHETAAGRPLSTMRRPQGFLSGRLSGSEQERLHCDGGKSPCGCRLVIRGGLYQTSCVWPLVFLPSTITTTIIKTMPMGRAIKAGRLFTAKMPAIRYPSADTPAQVSA